MKNVDKFYMNGAWVSPHSQEKFPMIDPSTEEVYGHVALGNQADTDAAVSAAKQAFARWRLSSKSERVELLESILDVYLQYNDDMAAAISQEMGAPIDMAKSDQVGVGTAHIKAFIDTLKDFEFEHGFKDSQTDQIIYEPIGVSALITPWNWPMNQITLKVIPAIATGGTCVLKPSEMSPLSGLLWSDIMNKAGVPAGVYNMVNGDGAGVGHQLSVHPDVDMVSFTGSTRAGQAITVASAQSVKRVSLELGGKGANIIFADADTNAVERGAVHCFENTGQSCNAPTRMLVERAIYDMAVSQAVKIAQKTQVKSAHETGDHMGPLVNAAQFEKVQHMIQVGIDEGAKLVAGGGGRPEGMSKGYYVRPTVFADCHNDMQIVRQEIFGPVLCIIPFDTQEEAIAIANDSDYGLTHYVQSRDPEKCRRVARAVRSGMVDINGVSRARGTPFGGVKQSGNGREGGVWGLHEFLEVRAIGGWPMET